MDSLRVFSHRPLHGGVQKRTGRHGFKDRLPLGEELPPEVLTQSISVRLNLPGLVYESWTAGLKGKHSTTGPLIESLKV